MRCVAVAMLTIVSLVIGMACCSDLESLARLVAKGVAGRNSHTLLAATWFARQNHFEWMFNPLAKQPTQRRALRNSLTIATSSCRLTKWRAAAYPIRLMAYHHWSRTRWAALDSCNY